MTVDESGPDHYAVIGHPVGHSLSPRIHREFARLTGQRLSYERIDVPPAEFDAFWHSGTGARLAGANITLPLKEMAFQLVDDHSPRAEAAGAVNTVIRREDVLIGDNTDGYGAVRDIEVNRSWSLAKQCILVVGAGGAARGVVAALEERGPSRIVVANRTESRARTVAAAFANVEWASLADPGRGFDGIINATSCGHEGLCPPLPGHIAEDQPWCYDLSYGAAAQPFAAWCRDAGLQRFADGLGMLVEQAAESFRLWRGVLPPTGGLIAALRREQDATG